MAATASSKPRVISSGHRLNLVLSQCRDPAPVQGPERAELEYPIGAGTPVKLWVGGRGHPSKGRVRGL